MLELPKPSELVQKISSFTAAAAAAAFGAANYRAERAWVRGGRESGAAAAGDAGGGGGGVAHDERTKISLLTPGRPTQR